MKLRGSELVYQVFIFLFVLLLVVVCFFPLLYVVCVSLTSEAEWIERGKLMLIPLKPTLAAYQKIFTVNASLLGSLGISTMRTIIGTVLSLSSTLFLGYAVSRRDMPGTKPLMFLVLFTVLFNGGLMPNFSGYESSMSSIGVLRTVSAKAAADPKKMEIICRYLDEGSYPNEDYFVLRAGYKCDGYDILEKMDNGFWFLGKSSKENVTVRQQGSILFGWGQMVQAELPFYIQSQESSMTAVDKYRQDMIAAVYNAKHYPGSYQMINADATLTTDSDNCVSEFEIAYILGNKTESDYDAFVSQWKSVAGDQLYAAAEEAFIQYGLTK